MKLFKWIIGSQRVPHPAKPTIEISGAVVVVLAETEEQAREILAADPDIDTTWFPVARLVVLDLDRPRLVTAIY